MTQCCPVQRAQHTGKGEDEEKVVEGRGCDSRQGLRDMGKSVLRGKVLTEKTHCDPALYWAPYVALAQESWEVSGIVT